MLTEIPMLIIVTCVMYGIAVGHWPLLSVNRTSIALIGSAALLVIGAVTPAQAWKHVDGDTLAILAGMMLINGAIEESGLYGNLTTLIVRHVRHARQLLAVIMLLSAVLSALFLNDTVVLLFTPFVLILARETRAPAIPLLLGLAISANIGSAATITGNPQNILIGALSGLSFTNFLTAMLPTVAMSLFVAWGMLAWMFRQQLQPLPPAPTLPDMVPVSRQIIFMIIGLAVLFVVGVAPVVAVLGIATLTLLQRRTPSVQRLQHIDSGLLLFFVGLFIVTGTFQHSQSATHLYASMQTHINADVLRFGAVSVILSNLISNVPAVILLSPLVTTLPQTDIAWIMLAASSTLAGNTTLLASVANLIVAERAMQQGVQISFAQYLRVGLPVTCVSLVIAGWFLS
jgi:Na+/H+ antiporter NhaD/arsenite permease-like protein